MNPSTNQTGTQHAGQDFAQYARFILKAVEEALERAEITYVQEIAILIQLSNATNKAELEETIKRLQAKYPALKEVDFKEEVEVSEDLDEIVQTYVTHLIKEGKPKEAEAFAKLADADTATLENLKEQDPGFNTFLK